MKRRLALLLCLSLLAAVFPMSVYAAPAEPVTYTVTLADKGDGTATITAVVPANVMSGKIVITPSANLTYIAGSLTSGAPGMVTDNENYNMDGVAGQCVVFAASELIPEGTVVFEADYTTAAGAQLSEADIICRLWDLADGEKKVGTQADGEVVKVYVPRSTPAFATYTVTLADNGDSTATMTAVVPANVMSGLIAITPSENLSYMEGSLKSEGPNAELNEDYDKDGVTGQCVSFAACELIPEGTLAFRANYAVKDGAVLSADDIICSLWNLSNGKVRIGDQNGGGVTKVYIPCVQPVFKTYTVTLTDKGDGRAAITAAIPVGVASGKIVVGTSADLVYIPGSLKSEIPNAMSQVNEHYNADGVGGQCVVFALKTGGTLPEGSVVFYAEYAIAEGAELGTDDFFSGLWNLTDGRERISTQDGGGIVKVYVPHKTPAPVTYTVTLTDRGDGTAEIAAALPAGAASGKIVIGTSADLVYVPGSLSSVIPGASVNTNENYNRDGIAGQCVAFVKNELLPEGTVVFRAAYTIREGAVADIGDFFSGLWNLSDGKVRIGTQNDGDIFKVYIPPVTYTVRFVNWDGSLLGEEVVVQGAGATAPAVPPRTGYTFAGWDCGFSNVTQDMTVTALYKINIYLVRFADWNGYLIVERTVEYGKAAEPPAAPSRTGYTFAGWDCGFSNVTQDMTVTALYEVNSYNVRFTVNGEDYASAVCRYGDEVHAPAYEVPRGFVFSGWEVPAAMPAQDLTLDAALRPKAPAPVTYTVTLTDNGDGTATITAALPAGVASGKIVIDVSAELTLIPGSLKSVISGASKNENYTRDGVVGACVSFSSAGILPEGAEVFEAVYAIAEGAEPGTDDFYSDRWNISNGREHIASQDDGDVVKVYVPAPEYLPGDVNGDGEVDNLDSALILSYDAGLEDFTKAQLLAGDVNRDGEVDNLDSALILSYDAGIIDKF